MIFMNRRFYLSILLVLALSLTMIGCSKPPLTYDEQISLGDKYLSEGNYKEAILAFEAAIKIDPKNVPAYLGIADAYIALGDVPSAVAALQKGIDITNNAEIKLKLDNIIIEETSETSIEESTTDNTAIEESPTNEAVNADENVRELSEYFIGRIPTKNLTYNLETGDLLGNDEEGFIGYTTITFDLDNSDIDPETADKIKTGLIAEWKEVPFTNEELIYICKRLTGIWGDMNLEESEPITQVIGNGFPTYESDRGKQFEVCLVLCDDQSAAIGYCVVEVLVPLE